MDDEEESEARDEASSSDVYELTQNLTRSFDLRYPWSYFRRGDREWNAAFLAQSVASNYFGRLRAYHWMIALDVARAQAGDIASDDGLRPYVMAQAQDASLDRRRQRAARPGHA